MISASDISFAYDGSVVLAGAGLLARPGEVVGLIGPNGSGKTTMLRILYAALKPSAGLVSVDERRRVAQRQRHLSKRIGVVAQESPSEIPLTVARDGPAGPLTSSHLVPALHPRRLSHRSMGAHPGGSTAPAERNFGRLSGGEKQRVLIARTLAQQADHLLLDEPTNHLDIGYQHGLLDLVGPSG